MPATSGVVISRAIAAKAVTEKDAEFWTNQELIPLLRQMRDRANDQSRPPLNIRDFGAVGDWDTSTDDVSNLINPDGSAASTDDSAAIAACLAKAKATGLAVLIPRGNFRCDTPLDCTGPLGLCIIGLGWESRIVSRCTGKTTFDTVGNYACTFSNFSVRGSQTGVPSSAFLSARTTGNGSAGLHHFDRIITDGHFADAARMSVSSEVNTYTDCRFDNSANGGWGVAILAQNDFGVTSDYAAIASPQVGGNTEHFFSNCVVEGFSSDGTGGCFIVKDSFGFKCSNLFMTAGSGTGNAECGIRLQGGITNMCLTGLGGELATAAHGIVVAAGCTLAGSHISGSIYNDIYGADTSVMQTTSFSGYFAAASYPIDAYDLNNCTLSTTTLGWRARNSQTGNIMLSTAAAASISNSASAQGGFFPEVEAGGDGVTRYRMRMDLGTASRTLTRQLSSYLMQTRMKVYHAPLSSGTFTPDPRTDGGVYFIEVDRAVTINAPTGFSINAASGDAGCRLSFVFLQNTADTVTFNAVYKKNWTQDTTIGRYNTISFWQIDAAVLIQDGGDVGLT